MDSLNGTYVNGLRLGGRDQDGQRRVGSPTHLTLYHGDVVRVGATCIRVTTGEEAAGAEPVPEQGLRMFSPALAPESFPEGCL
jgi:hypothetical protein